MAVEDDDRGRLSGIVAMTRQLAMEGRTHGIRANSISPGLIETSATSSSMAG
jgi:NAD(P)-dependent dehydrogenase (short-subunit alcohol dehydrogenase family)